MTPPDFALAMQRIDQANAQDPNLEDGQPKALLHGQRMSAQLAGFAPSVFPQGASPELQIAARAQHICRWMIPRESYPEGRAGYLAWRKALGAFHAQKTGEIMAEAGYGPEAIERVGGLLRKEALKQNAETQTLEDVICLVFLRHELAAFGAKHAPEKLADILGKTWKKMSAAGHEAALKLDLPEDVRRWVG